jgi:hypothetical protein
MQSRCVLYLSYESIQFVGDIHQPLHDENLDVGGNDIDVTFGGTSTNLHHIVSPTSPALNIVVKF